MPPTHHFIKEEAKTQSKESTQGYTKVKCRQDENSNFGVSDSKVCALPYATLLFSKDIM